MDRAATKPSAAYGHACLNCVKAKCKCIPRDGDSCERCHRLSKDCQPASFVRKKRQKAGRTSQLEDKLDSLVTLLQAQQAPTPSPSPGENGDSFCAHEQPHAGRPSKPFPSGQSPYETVSLFRTRYLPYFPLIHIPADRVSIEAFVCERPDAYRAIQVLCEKNRACQKEWAVQVREEVVLRVVTDGQRSIDLLLCMLVCLIWQVHFTPSRRGGFGMFGNIAKHMIADLGYNRPTGIIMACPRPPILVGQSADQRGVRSDEERRALVVCFTVAAISALAIKSEPMKWSSQISEACNRLSQNLDIKGDMVLVAMARISRVSVEAYHNLQHVSDDIANAPQSLHQIKALRIMLDVVKGGFTQDQLQDPMVLTYFYGVQVQIYEPSLYGLSLPTATLGPDYLRIEYFTTCLQACKSSLDNYLTMPTITLNMPQVLAFSNSCQVLYSLCVVDCLGWDRYAARATADVLWYFDQVSIRYGEACRQMQEETGCEENIFSIANGHEGLKSLTAKWKESLETATGATMDFAGEVPAVEDAWITNADLLFNNIWGDVQF